MGSQDRAHKFILPTIVGAPREDRLVYFRGMQLHVATDDGSLVGTVEDVYLDREKLKPRAIVRHFNGELWPVEPYLHKINALLRDWEKG